MSGVDRSAEKRKEEDIDLKYRNQRWGLGLAAVESILSRHSKIKDPMARQLLLTEKLCAIADIGLAGMKNWADEENIDDTLKLRVEHVIVKIRAELDVLIDWVQTPVYSPEHPWGNYLMTESVNDAVQLSKNNE